MNRFLSLFVITVFCCFSSSIAIGQDNIATSKPCSKDRPCGPSGSGLLSLLVPQGWKGADFRETCTKHDSCYEILGVKRGRCDEQFLEGLLASCENSRRPRQCKRVVRIMSRIIKKRGQNSFEEGQKIARQSARG